MTQREFAIEVVETLQAAGYQALWAGGCVRDQMLGCDPKDYDVATDAHPDIVRKLFGKNRTLPIGASFGVITVLGPKVIINVENDANAEGGTQTVQHVIEVATFRRDTGYSDGRRPEGVEFTDAREDAIRRDFTINGMFFDPIKDEVIDYVGGREDLDSKVIRAIGNPHERIEEDKLRMLRGIRFASTFDFKIDPNTLAAIQNHAGEIGVVSGERIGAEMRRMLANSKRASAVQLLRKSKLLAEVVPEGLSLCLDDQNWNCILERLARLDGDFESAAASLLEPIILQQGTAGVFQRWKLSNSERKSIQWICKHWRSLDQATELPWSQVQPLILHVSAKRALAVADSWNVEPSQGVAFCRECLKWPVEKLNPKPFLDGADLISLGIKQGPKFKQILDAVRAAQLDRKIETIEQAKQFARAY